MTAPTPPFDFDQIITLLEAPLHWSKTQGQQTAYTFLENSGRHDSLTYEQLIQRALSIAAGLEQAGATGERVLLLYPPGLDFVCSFWGCLFAGAIAVPAYPPDPNRLQRTLGRVVTIVSDCDAKFALTNANIVAMAQYMFPQGEGLQNIQWLASETLLETDADHWTPPPLSGDSIAFLQYTSGSTGAPKGVIISHSNILATVRALARDAGVQHSDVGITWVPFYHDLGLFVGILTGPLCGLHSMLMSPLDFLRQPAKWLQYISEFGATVTSGPNFAYELCLQRITDAELATLDLSSLRVAISGGEPVQAQTLRGFAQQMAPAGFNEAAFFPGYGLAEVGLTICVSPWDSAPKIVSLDPDRLATGILEHSDAANAIEVVSNGPPHRELDVRIVDPDTLQLKGDQGVGEIWVRGPMVTAGYWEAPEATERAFNGHIADTGEGPFLRTGDSGFLLDGELYINGRFKEVIIIRGKNYFPVDIEKTITDLKWDHPSLRPGNCVAFSVNLEGQDQVVVLQEVEPRRHTPPLENQPLDDERRKKRFKYRPPPTENAQVDPSSPEAVHESLVAAIGQEVARAHSIQLHAVYLLWPGSIPKTSSGKLQRNESRKAFNSHFLEGTCEVFYGWRQPPKKKPLAQPARQRSSTAPANQPTPDEVVQWVSQWFARELGIPLDQIQPEQDIMAMGVDSASVALLVTELEAWLGEALDPSLIWDFRSIADLSNYLASEAAGTSPAATEVEPPPPPAEGAAPPAAFSEGAPALHPNWPPSLDSTNYGSHARVALAARVKAVGLDKSYRAARGDQLVYSQAGADVSVLDMVGGYGSTLLGHNHPEIVELAAQCFHRNLPMHTQGSWRHAAGDLCRQLSDQVGQVTGKDYFVTLANSGAEAVEAAIKHLVMEYRARSEARERDVLSRCDALARLTSAPALDASSFATWSIPTTSLQDAQDAVCLHNQRLFAQEPTLVALEDAFHGKTLGALSLTHKAAFREPFPWARRDVTWVPRDSANALNDALEQASDTALTLVQDADGLVRVEAQPWCKCLGIFIEPVLGEAGVHPLQRSYCETLRQLANQHSVPVVIDEIQSGMGRCGAFLASSLLGIQGDYYTFAKSLGASVAKTAAMLVERERYLEDFGWIHTSTFAEDDFSSLVALKGLEILQRDRLAERAQRQGEKLSQRLQGLVAAFPDVLIEVRGMGLMQGLEFRALTDSPSAILRAASGLNVLSYLVAGYLLNEEGIRIAPTTSAEMTLRVEPSAYIDDDAVLVFAGALERVCTILRNANAGRLLRHLVGASPAPTEPITDYRDLQPPLQNTEPGDCPKIAFLGYVIDVNHLPLLDASLEEIPTHHHNDLVRCLSPVLEPFLSQRLRVTSPTGAEVDLYCYGLLWTSDVIEETLAAGNRNALRHRIQQAVDLAREEGCVSMGFAGYTSIITRNCKDVFAPKMGLTTGNSLTAASGILAIERRCAELGIDLQSARVGIVGAAGNIGSIYARLIAEQVPAMVLVGRERSAHRLRDLAKEILVEAFAEKDSNAGISRQLHAAPWFEEVPERFEKGESLGGWLLNQQSDPEGSSPLITVTTDLKRLAECDVILCTSSSAQPLVLPEHLKQGPLVICDLAVPGDVDPSVHQSCPEASVISGGILSLTHNPQLSYLGSPLAPGHIFACMGETLLMGLDGHRDHLSIGDIHKYQVKRIRDSAERHGFEVILPVDYSGRLL